jgi:hypothetical protein
VKTFETIVTPATARAWLDTTPEHQRKVSPVHVARLARAMVSGTYMMNPQPFVLDTAGVLIDGQHRCHAIIAAGVDLPAMVTTDADPALFSVIDLQQRRAASQFLGRNGGLISAASKTIGLYYATAGQMTNWPAITNESIAMTLERVEAMPMLRMYAENIRMISKESKLPAGHLLAHTVIVEETSDRDLLGEWHRGLQTGEDLAAGDPRLVLRARWAGGRHTTMNIGDLSKRPSWSMIVQAWNAYRIGSKVGVLRYRTDRNMPVIAGSLT